MTDTNIIVATFNEDESISIDLQSLLDGIEALDNNIKFKGIVFFRNQRYVSIHFENKNIKQFVEENLRKVNQYQVVYLNCANQRKTHHVKIHWLPLNTDMKLVRKEMEKYFELSEETLEERLLFNGEKAPSGVISYTTVPKKDCNVNKIPHVAEIDGFECLYTISGRKILCLSCDKLGHKSAFCPTPYCGRCGRLQPKEHVCDDTSDKTRSFANVVKGTKQKYRDDVENNWKEERDIIQKERWTTKEGEQNKQIDKESSKVNELSQPDTLQTEVKEELGKEKIQVVENNCLENNAALGQLQNFFTELQKLNVPILIDKDQVLKISEPANDANKDLEEDMDVNQKQLKRKISNGSNNNTSSVETSRSNRGSRTYSKRGGGGRGQETVKARLERKFDETFQTQDYG